MILELLSTPEVKPFSVALIIVCGLAIIEGIGLLFGIGLSGIADHLDGNKEILVDTDTEGMLGSLIAWLKIKQVPFIIILIVFLTAFAVSGFFIQQLTEAALGIMMPAFIASVIAFALSLPVLRTCCGLIRRYTPGEHTSAVSVNSFIGHVAVISLGTARKGYAAQAKLRDTHGQEHYIMVEPDDSEAIFAQGQSVLLVRRENALFYAISNDHSLLVGSD